MPVLRPLIDDQAVASRAFDTNVPPGPCAIPYHCCHPIRTATPEIGVEPITERRFARFQLEAHQFELIIREQPTLLVYSVTTTHSRMAMRSGKRGFKLIERIRCEFITARG